MGDMRWRWGSVSCWLRPVCVDLQTDSGTDRLPSRPQSHASNHQPFFPPPEPGEYVRTRLPLPFSNRLAVKIQGKHEQPLALATLLYRPCGRVLDSDALQTTHVRRSYPPTQNVPSTNLSPIIRRRIQGTDCRLLRQSVSVYRADQT